MGIVSELPFYQRDMLSKFSLFSNTSVIFHRSKKLNIKASVPNVSQKVHSGPQ